MRFAIGWPWWVSVLLVAVVAMTTIMSFRHGVHAPGRRLAAALAVMRALTLAVLVWCVLMPTGVRTRPESDGTPLVAVMLDGSNSMLIDEGGRTKQERVTTEMGGWFDGLGHKTRVRWFQFASGLTALPSFQAWHPDGRNTDLASGLESLSRELEGSNVAGVVIVSDGHYRGAASPIRAAEVFRSQGWPVWTVGAGANRLTGDVALKLAAPERVRREEDVEVAAEVISRGWSGVCPLVLKVDGRVVERATVTLGPGKTAGAKFTVKPDARQTLMRCEVVLEVKDAAIENNTAAALVRVEDPERPEVLLIAGAPTWEGRFMTRVFEEETKARVVILTRVVPGEPLTEQRVRVVGGRPKGFPDSDEDLRKYRAVVLVNVPADMLSQAELDRLNRFVVERGGGLAWVGNADFLAPAWEKTPVSDALPVHLVASSEPDSAVEWQLTDEGNRHAIFRGTSGWEDLPPLDNSAPAAQAKPAAQVLAVRKDGKGVLMAVQRYGKGRTVLVASDALWRWRMNRTLSDGHHERFWRQTLAWLTADASDVMNVRCSSTSVGWEEPLVVEADVFTESRQPHGSASVEMVVKDVSGGVVVQQEMAPVQGAAGTYRGVWRGKTAGAFSLSVIARDRSGFAGRELSATPREPRGQPLAIVEARVLGEMTRSIEVRPVDLEKADQGVRDSVLKEVADMTQGRYALVEEAAHWPVDAFRQSDRPVPLVRDIKPLWHASWVWGLVVAALGVEWIMRKLGGLA